MKKAWCGLVILLCVSLFMSCPQPTSPTATSTVSLSGQSGIMTSGTAGSVTFAATTANIAAGTAGVITWYTTSVGTATTSTPTGVTASVSSVANNTATITMTASTSAVGGLYFFKLSEGSTVSAIATFTIALSFAQQIAALPSPSMLGVAQYSAKSISKAFVPFSAATESPVMSTGFFVDGIANGGMDSISAGIYAQVVSLLKSLSQDQLAIGSHSFAFPGGQTLNCAWSENSGTLRILSSVAGNFRNMIEITQASGKIAAVIVTKVLSPMWAIYYIARYDEGSQTCEILFAAYDSSNAPDMANAVYAKNTMVSGATLIGLVQTSSGVAARAAAIFSDPSGTLALHGTDLEYYRPNGSPFLIIDSQGENYRVADMTTYPANLAYDNANGNAHPLFIDANANNAFDTGDTDIAGATAYQLLPMAITSAGAAICDNSAAQMRPFIRIGTIASLPSGFIFDSALLSLKSSLDAKLQARAIPFADGLIGYDKAPLVAFIAAEEAATYP
jgi:hypothetical protein